MVYYTVIHSPIDPLILTSDGTALTGLYMTPHQYSPTVATGWLRDENTAPLREAVRQLKAYFAVELSNFDLPLRPKGTPFQQRVWAELRTIPFGVTISYGELARRLGDVKASRAVGLANSHNPISIIVPCHRVIGANGKLTGYGGGLPRKQALLAFEAQVRAGSQVALSDLVCSGQIGLL